MPFDPKYGNITPEQQLGYATGEGIGAAIGDFIDGVRQLRAEEARRARAKQQRQQNMKEAIAQYKAVIARHEAYIANLEKLSNTNAAYATAFRRTAFQLGEKLGLTKEQVREDFRAQMPGAEEAVIETLVEHQSKHVRIDI